MRRTGLVLAGLGAFLIVFALLQAFWVTGQVIKFPLNQYASVTLTDPNATYFSAAKLTEMSGVNLEATYTIKGKASAGSSSTAVWDQFIYVYDQTNKLPVQTITRTFAFDRRTAQLVNCCGANVNGDSSIQQHGYVGYVLPIGTKKQTYDVFDTNLNKPVPFTYTGIGEAGGTQAYKFTVNVAPTQNGTQTVPGSLVNSSAASVTLPQYYEVHSTYWIDPVTGALLNVTQDEKLTLRNTDGSTALVLLNANLAATQASIDGLVAIDNNQLSKASLVGTLLPLVAGLAGLLLLIIGLVLFRRPDDVAEAAPSHRESELAAAPEAASHSLVPGLDDEPSEATVASPVVREAAVGEAGAGAAAAGAAAAEAKAADAKAADAKAADAEAADAKTAMLRAEAAPAAEGAAPAAPAADAKAAGARAADAKAAAAEAEAEQAEAKAEDKAAEAGAEPASAAAADGAAEAKAEAAQAETAAGRAKAEAAAKGEEAQAAEAQAAPAAAADAKDGDAPAEAPTAEIPATEADTTESPATDADATAETPATSRRRRGAHRR
jgi:Porin PorA